jgi:hypothetical protein
MYAEETTCSRLIAVLDVALYTYRQREGGQCRGVGQVQLEQSRGLFEEHHDDAGDLRFDFHSTFPADLTLHIQYYFSRSVKLYGVS